jgi:hypothetical protein
MKHHRMVDPIPLQGWRSQVEPLISVVLRDTVPGRKPSGEFKMLTPDHKVM